MMFEKNMMFVYWNNFTGDALTDKNTPKTYYANEPVNYTKIVHSKTIAFFINVFIINNMSTIFKALFIFSVHYRIFIYKSQVS